MGDPKLERGMRIIYVDNHIENENEYQLKETH